MSKKQKTTGKQPWLEMSEAEAKRLPGALEHVHTYSTPGNARRKAKQVAGGHGQVVIAISEESKECSVLIHREKATAEDMKAVAAADQENAQSRDERQAAPDGMTASERAMAKSASRNVAAKKTAKKTAAEVEPKRMSALDAAAQILAKSKNAMSCKRIVELATDMGLWTTTGKTPHATLYSAIIREIAKKGNQARFRKIDRGRFAFNAAQAE